VRPWVWLLLTALGGWFLPTVTNDYYCYLAVRHPLPPHPRPRANAHPQSTTLARIHAILTSLLFNHELRACLVASSAAAAAAAASSAPASLSSSTAASVSSSVTPSAPRPADGEARLAARLSDLATVDLANMLGGYQFLLLLLDVLLEFALGVGASLRRARIAPHTLTVRCRLPVLCVRLERVRRARGHAPALPDPRVAVGAHGAHADCKGGRRVFPPFFLPPLH
jgi:hypothetical protein